MFKVLISLVLFGFGASALAQNGYESQKGCAKFQYIWTKQVMPTQYRALPALTGSFTDAIKVLTSNAILRRTFDRSSDFYETPQKKIIHTFGSVVGLRFEPVRSKYTGLLGTPHKCILARFSLAGDPKLIGFTPGVALKFFVDGQPSRNIVVMNSLDGQGSDHNFFAKPFSNIIPRPRSFSLRILEGVFARVKSNPRQLTVDHLVKVKPNGQAVTTAFAPEQIVLRPAKPLSSDPRVDFRNKLRAVPKGTVVYLVYARDANSGQYVGIGRLRTITPFVASSFGDSRLFFKHQR